MMGQLIIALPMISIVDASITITGILPFSISTVSILIVKRVDCGPSHYEYSHESSTRHRYTQIERTRYESAYSGWTNRGFAEVAAGLQGRLYGVVRRQGDRYIARGTDAGA
jgi:hypothetical protein